nr:ubiquitin hydrolase [Tanacetum cinerariifolium]
MLACSHYRNVSKQTTRQDIASAFIASQSNGSQIKFEDINQIDKDDMEEMNIKWNMALLSMRADKFWKRTRKKISIQGSDVDWSYMANEEDHALVADEETPTEFALMANIENKDVVDRNLARLLKSSKDLEDIIESQRSDKPKDSQPESKSKEQETPKKSQVKYAKQYRHSNKKPKGNQRNWNNLKSYQLGPELVLHKKPCFNCGDFSHLANNCRRRVQRETNRSQNHSYKSPSHRSTSHRPNGANMRPPLRSSGPRPHGDSVRSFFRPTGHRPHAPSMNPRRPTMNGARPYKSFFQAPSYETRPFLKSSA